MRLAIIGRTQWLFSTMCILRERGFEIGAVITSEEAPDYEVKSVDFKNYCLKNNIPFFFSRNGKSKTD